MSNSPESSAVAMPEAPNLSRWFAMAYGGVAYVLFLVVFSAFALWVGNLFLPFSVDRGLGWISVTSTWQAVLLNIVLVAGFAIQHTIMARRGFKRWLTRIIPVPVERSTFMYAGSIMLLLIMLLWQPLTGTVWNVSHPLGQAVIWVLFTIGWVGVVASSFMINHFELFGLMQVMSHAASRNMKAIPFRTPWMYKWVRHPMMFFIIIGLWAIPHMTVGHLVLAVAFTLYIIMGVRFEERDLEHTFGDDYRSYQKTTPQFVPMPFLRRGNEP